MKKGFLRLSDSATMYYEVKGHGKPIILVHGWGAGLCYFKKNVEDLSKNFQVITVDLRGHGKSSKGSDGYNLQRLATDLYELITYLNLKNVTMLGWSLGGPLMLAYYKKYGKKKGRLKALGLIDMTPYPFSKNPKNSHSLRNFNAEGFNDFAIAYAQNRKKFAKNFVATMFKNNKITVKTKWMEEAAMKLPTTAGIALYSDYVYGDYTKVLAKLDLPVIIFAANSGIFPNSIKQGKWEASLIKNSKLVKFKKGGHIMFYLEAKKFNNALRKFMKKIS